MGSRVAFVLAIGILTLALVLDFSQPSTDLVTTGPNEDTLTTTIARNKAISEQRKSNPTALQTIEVESQPDSDPEKHRIAFKHFQRGPDVQARSEFIVQHRWLDTPTPIDSILEKAEQMGRNSVFGWIQVAPGSEHEQLRVDWLALDVQTIGFNGEFARVRFPNSPNTLAELVKHPGVVGMGIQPSTEKISTPLASRMDSATSELPVLISLIETDRTGSVRMDLEARGAVVGEWLPYARAYAANASAEDIPAIAEADYVVMIEPIEVFRVLLDTAVPVMGADGVRTYSESRGAFTGTTGESTVVGIIDTGLNIDHKDIASGRSSICGANFYPDNEGDGRLDLWSDYGGHGTHVAGIIAGNGSVNPAFAGMAPSIQHLRIAKVLDRDGSGDSVTVANGVRYLLGETACEWQDTQSEALKPLVLNMSIGGNGERNGRGATNRSIDSVVSYGSQLLVLAAGNDGVDGTSNESTAKNVLSVGAVTDAGAIAIFSGHGPTADGRLNPHVVGTGSSIVSASGNSSNSTYARARGTSMAAPSVAGVAALLMDVNPAFRNAPAYAKARLMASAIKPSNTLGLEDFPLTNSNGPGAFNAEYGLGLVSASIAISEHNGSWSHGGDYAQVEASKSYRYELEVAENTARLDIVLTWMESPNAAVARTTVVANLDLYLDEGGDCGSGACGEYASTSPNDNVEWIVVKDPKPGTYQLKIVASNDFADSVYAGIAWTAISDTDTPTLTITADEQTLRIEPGSTFEVDLDVTVDGFLSAGTTVHMACRSESPTGCDGYEDVHWMPTSFVSRRDQVERTVNTPVDVTIPLGEIRSGDEQNLSLAIPRRVALENHTLYFVATSWNAISDTVAVKVLPEGREAAVTATKPTNDAMRTPKRLRGESGETPFDLLLATREPGEPLVQVDTSDTAAKKFFADTNIDQSNYDKEMEVYARHGSVWFAIVAERSGPYRISIEPESIVKDTWIAVYDGRIALASNRITMQESTVEFDATSSQSYLVQVWTSEPARPSLQLTWNQFPERKPENDDFEDRTTLRSGEGMVAGTNYRASLENFEYYGVKSQGVSTWYRWMAPASRRYVFQVSNGLSVFVFDGTNTGSLRRVSTMPNDDQEVQFEAEENREYQIVVVDAGERLVPDYELTWRAAPSYFFGYARNDMIEDASRISGRSGEERVPVYYSAKTVEPNEDIRTGVGTSWWRWKAPFAGTYTFRIDGSGVGKLAVFTGTASDDIEYVTDGESVSFSAEADDQYWISVGYRHNDMFADIDELVPARNLSWGQLPENDIYTSAHALTGTTGRAEADHSFATSSADQFGHIRGHSSLWWNWVASDLTWQRFALGDWESERLEEHQQGILAVYQQRAESTPLLIATSDHSYIANGRAEAVFLAEEDQEYLIRVALRSTDLEDWDRRQSFTYEPVNVPAWQRYAGRRVEVGGSNEEVHDARLFEPRSIAVAEELGLVVVATGDGLLAYTEDANGTLALEVAVPYANTAGETVEVSDGATLHWDANSETLYLIQKDGIFEISEPVTASSRMTSCASGNPDSVIPAQVVTDSASENMYVFGSGLINVYAMRDVCDIEPLQNVISGFSSRSELPSIRHGDLAYARSIALSNTDERIYAAGGDGLTAFKRKEDGSLTRELTYRRSAWAPNAYFEFRISSVALGSDDVLFMVGDRSLAVAAFDVSNQVDGRNPEFLGFVNDFHISNSSFFSSTFYSHVAQPTAQEGCRAGSTYNQSDAVSAVDVFCDGQVYTVRWDDENEQLFIADWFQHEQTDRFGRFLGEGLTSLAPRKIVENVHGNRNYVLGAGSIGNLHVFDRASRITDNPYTE